MLRPSRWLGAALVAVVIGVGCGGDHLDPKQQKSKVELAQDACMDTAYEMAWAFDKRCGGEFNFNLMHPEFLAAFNCPDITRVRDEDQLRNDCFSRLPQAKCADLVSGNVPQSCRDQLHPE